MFINKTNKFEKNTSFSTLQSTQKKEKIFKKVDLQPNKGEKYLSPVFSTMAGATYNYENFK
tara:strand:- start:240 stop:422 length:183 start_codon:yes stop_codon:yes gene_type:complete